MELKVKSLKDVVIGRDKALPYGSGNFTVASCYLPGMGIASIRLAKMRGVDPLATPRIDALKRRLQR